MNRFIPLLLIALVFGACQNSKHFTKLGQKQEAAGLTREAAESFYTALLKKRANLDAQIGLKKNGQLVLNTKLNDFSQKNSFGSRKEAVYAFHEARDYKNRIAGVGVELQIPDYQNADYEKAKRDYLTELYEKGTKLLEDNKFAEAEGNFNEISTLDPNFKDAGELKDIAYIEPIYQKAQEAFEAKRYRACYENILKVEQRKLNYKEASSLKSQSLEKGMYTVALLPFKNGTPINGADIKIAAYLLDELTKLNDPFLKVVDRENMNSILAEQRFQMSGIFNESMAVEVGKIAGAKAIISGTVLNHTSSQGTLRKVTRSGFESYQVKKVNAEGKAYYETAYNPISYDEYFNSAEANVSIQYKLTSLETATMLKSSIVEKSNKDEILYATYGGNSNNLYPANGNMVNTSNKDRNTLQNMLKAKRNLKDPNEMANDLYIEIAKQIASEIKAQLQTLVP